MKGLVLSAEWRPKDGYEVTEVEERSRRARQGNMVWRNPTIAVGDRPDPRIEDEHDVIIRNRACGICGTDLHLAKPDADGYLDLAYTARAPIAIGHEYAGEVVEVGPAVTRVRPGDLVAVETQVNCQKCRACLRGLPNSCRFLQDRGISLDGGTAGLSVADERNCWPLTGVAQRYGPIHAIDAGALVEPASVVYNGMVRLAGGFLPGDAVAVLGCGPIGLAAVALARALGAGPILAVELSAAKRELAMRMGATAAFDPASGTTSEWVLEQTDGIGADMAVDASGAGRVVLPSILDALAVGGKIIGVGANMEPVEIDTLALNFRSASAHFTLGHLGGGFPAVIALATAGRLDLTPMITARYPLAGGVAALDRARQGQDGKILIYANGVPEHS